MGMFDNTNAFGAPGAMGGYAYNPQAGQQVKVMNNLSADEINTLQQQRSQFSLGLTEREILQGACNHRSADGTQDSLVYDNETGLARCTICGYEFRPIDPDATPDDIKEAADRLVDILQTIKIMYTDLPANAAREYFQIIPLIGKVPELFKFAAKNFAKHEFNSWQYNNGNMGGIAMLQGLSNIFGGGMMGQPMMGNPAMMGQPMQPMMQPQMGQPMANPFGYPGASMASPNPVLNGGYQPNTMGYQYQPPQGSVPVQPTVNAGATPDTSAAADTTVTEKVTV